MRLSRSATFARRRHPTPDPRKPSGRTGNWDVPYWRIPGRDRPTQAALYDLDPFPALRIAAQPGESSERLSRSAGNRESVLGSPLQRAAKDSGGADVESDSERGADHNGLAHQDPR